MSWQIGMRKLLLNLSKEEDHLDHSEGTEQFLVQESHRLWGRHWVKLEVEEWMLYLKKVTGECTAGCKRTCGGERKKVVLHDWKYTVDVDYMANKWIRKEGTKEGRKHKWKELLTLTFSILKVSISENFKIYN